MGQYFTNDENIKSEIKKISGFLMGVSMSFFTDNGVFSKNAIDFGSRLLLETIQNEDLGDNVLDVGCGYGTIGLTINKKNNCHVVLCDVNKRALHLTFMNAKENNCNNVDVIESDCYSNIKCKFSSIVTNPPIRAGKEVVYNILENAKKYLISGGALYFVVRKEQGAKSIITNMKNLYNLEIMSKKKGFFIIKCVF